MFIHVHMYMQAHVLLGLHLFVEYILCPSSKREIGERWRDERVGLKYSRRSLYSNFGVL